jgi:hypothetical protein
MVLNKNILATMGALCTFLLSAAVHADANASRSRLTDLGPKKSIL